MAKVERDVKKDINKEVVVLEYSIIGKTLSLFFRLIMLYLGIIMFLMGKGVFFLGIIGSIVIIYAIYSFIDILLFKRLKINSDNLIKEWHINTKICISLDELVVSKTNLSIGGIIDFKTSRNNFISFLTKVYILPLGIENVKKLKEILIKNKVLKGDEYEWID